MKSKHLYIALLLSTMVIPAVRVVAQGSLMVNPKRIVLDERKRVGEITLFNSGNDSADYVISLTHYEMLPDGGFKDIPDSVHVAGILYSDSVVRYFPLQVTLGPHESQAVHVRFMKPQNMVAGEYRSHMYFRAIQKAKALEQVAQDTSQHTISLSLTPIFGLSIPIIVRYQTNPAIVTVDSGYVNTSLDTGGNGVVYANLNRSGNESCYGSLLVFFKDQDGHETQVGILKGIAVYTPLPTRHISVGYHLDKGVDPMKGTFRLQYQTLTDNPKEQVLAEAVLTPKK